MRPLLLLLFACPALAQPADLVIRGGEAVTLDPSRPRAKEVAIRGDRIVAVGEPKEIAQLMGPKTQVLEMAGGLVVPGLVDAHAHLVGLGISLARVDLRHCESAQACAERAARGSGAWVLGRGWDQNKFPDKAFPTRAVLDRALGDRPAWLTRIDGHAGWANGAALERAGITAKTPDPSGGRILRDAKGEPTGVLVDAAMSLMDGALPKPTVGELEAAILRAQDVALSVGLTGVHDMGISYEATEVYERLAREGKLKLRVRAYLDPRAALATVVSDATKHLPDARFVKMGVKLFSDGALGSRGAALIDPYSDDPKNRGLTVTDVDAITRYAKAARARGYQVTVHAIGDRGNRNVIEAYELAGVSPDDRFRIEHAQVVALDDIPRFVKLGVIASMQPTHATSDMPWAEARIGKERAKGAYAWRRMLEARVPLAFGSDFPVEEPSPVGGLRAAVERGGWTLDQKLTWEEALRAFTTGAAYAVFEENARGQIKKGQLADLTVLTAPLGKARATIIGGQVVWK
jgi:predicted amidohydrolase YtcJ